MAIDILLTLLIWCFVLMGTVKLINYLFPRAALNFEQSRLYANRRKRISRQRSRIAQRFKISRSANNYPANNSANNRPANNSFKRRLP